MNPVLWWSLCAVLMFVVFSLLICTWVAWRWCIAFVEVLRQDEKMTDGQIFQFLMDVLNFPKRRRLDAKHTLRGGSGSESGKGPDGC